MIDAIHIGDYKTGTSWLQSKVFLQHPELIYIDWPSSYPEIAKLFYELVVTRDLDFDPVDLRNRFTEEIQKIDHHGKRLIVSRESLSGEFVSGENAKRTAERIYSVFGPTKIILVIREQFSMLASIYSQYVKIGGTLSLRNFIWDPLQAKNLIDRVQYHKQIQIYVDLFGSDNVLVKLFDEMQHDRNNFLRDILFFSGCVDIDFLPEDSELSNRGLTTIGVVIQRALNRLIRTHTNPSANIFPLDKLVAMFLSARQKESLLQSSAVQLPWANVQKNPRAHLLFCINMALSLKFAKWCELISVGNKVSLPLDVRQSLRDEFTQDNRLLSSRYGLNLEKYKWVL